MLIVDEKGVVQDPNVRLSHSLILDKRTNTYPKRDSLSPGIYGGSMELNKIRGIIVHQTDTETASSTFNSYTNKGANGAHFLIDKDGKIYQTVPLIRVAHHVGWMKSRCILEQKCLATEVQLVTWNKEAWRHKQEIHDWEKKKDSALRFPNNTDSIGIELVGKAKYYDPNNPKKKHPEFNVEEVFEPLTEAQHESLRWLLSELAMTLKSSLTEIYRHPDVSPKNFTEGLTAAEDIADAQNKINAARVPEQ